MGTLAELEDLMVDAEEVFRINSYNLRSADVFTLTEHVLRAVADPEVDGVVVNHGTDTMEEAAYLVDLFHSGSKPVVLTGALRGPSKQDSDGPRNLRDAVRLAGSRAASGVGVVVAMAGHVVPARYAAEVSMRTEGLRKHWPRPAGWDHRTTDHGRRAAALSRYVLARRRPTAVAGR